MIKVLITDDHELLREGIKRVLAEEPDIMVAGEARSAAETIDLIAQEEFDVLVLDLGLPDRDGLDVIAEVRKRKSGIGILILTMRPEDQFGERVLAAGGDGYLTKESVSKELVVAIRKVRAGGKYLSPALAEQIASAVSRSAQHPTHAQLTSREFELLLRLAEGKTVAEIAKAYSLSPSTVYTYRTRILEKLNLRTDVEITRYAMENGLI